MRRFFVSAIAGSISLLAASAGFSDTPGPHPAYLHAISDLRDARAHLEHQANDPVDHEEEGAISNIDKALDEIKKAAIDDGKNVRDHMPVDAHLQRYDRFHQAMELLDKAEQDVRSEPDQPNTRGLQLRVINHINGARHEVHHAIDTVLHRPDNMH
jgi:hypothetical protein